MKPFQILIIIILFPLLGLSQNEEVLPKWHVGITTGVDYYKTNRVFSEVFILGMSDYNPNRPRWASHVGVSVSRQIFNTFYLESCGFYALSGFKLVPVPPSAGISSDYSRMENIHQIGLSLNPKYQFENHFALSTGISKYFNLNRPDKEIYSAGNWAYNFNFNYSIKKIGIGLGYIHYMTPYSDFKLFKYYWQVFNLNFNYTFASF